MSDKYPGGLIQVGAPAGYSAYFNGSSSSILVASNSSFAVTTGDFTVEAWLYWVSDTANSPTIFSIGTVNTSGGINIFVTSSTQIYVRMGAVGQDTYNTTTDVTLLGKWNHVAIVRSSGVLKIYLNGVSKTVTSTGASNSITANNPCIGAVTASNGFTNSYIASLRYSNTAVYTANFNPPTLLNTTSSTLLLTLQNPTFIDISPLSSALTVANSTIGTFTPFPAYTGFNPALGAAAGGVWTLDEAAYYQNNRQWPIYDPYFNQTTLMLHGNGTNGAQNNTFLDSSTNNFTITRNGNTTQGSFSPFSQTGWSYNGTAGAYCTLNNSDYSLSTGDFTVEFWMYCVDDSAYSAFCFASAPSNPNFTVAITGGSSNARLPYLEYGGSGTTFAALSGYLNKWVHIAFVRTSGNVVVYQNGVATGTPVSKSAAVGSTASLYLARNSGDSGSDFRGYLSNFRITKAAVYSSNFTPSTSPFVPITNTVLLAFQDNRFKDSSALNATVTPAGTASVQAFSPFVPTYITPTTYSNWFDDSTGYFSLASNAALAMSTGNFTIEAWIYPTAPGNICATRPISANTVTAFSFSVEGSGPFNLRWYTTSASTFTSSTSVPINAWSHVAIVRSGTTLTIYLNGVSIGTVTGGAGAYDYSDTSNGFKVGAGTDAGEKFGGFISNLRVVKGTAVYTANFTPPTAPLTAITNTSLLTCQSSTFIDNSTNNFAITSFGTVQPTATSTPFPAKVDQTTLNSSYSTTLIGGSGYFDGTGDYLSFSGPTIGTGAFCLEAWVYCTSTFSNQTIFGADGTNNRISIKINNSTTISVDQYGVSASNFTVATMALNAWNHIAVSRNGSSVATVFVNGVRSSTGTATLSNNYTTFNALGRFDSGTGYYLTGYIAGARATIGSTPYDPTQTGFAVPYAPPTAITNTSFLANFTNAGIFDDTARNTIETVSSVQLSSTQAKYGNTSMWFQAGGTLAMPNSPNLSFGTGDFTVEWWMYWNTVNNSGIICGSGTNSTDIRYSSGNLYLGKFLTSLDNSFAWTPTTGQWYHVAMTRQGTSVRAFVNGSQIGSTATGNAGVYNAVGTFYVGTTTFGSAGDTPLAYIDDLRITKGVARYVTNFTPPTSALQNQ